MPEIAIPEAAVEAATQAAMEHFEMPFMARVRDFTAEQLAAGALAEADRAAEAKNRGAVLALIGAAAPLIVATYLADLSTALRADLQQLKEYTHGSLAWRVINEVDARASVLRGEGTTDA